MWQVSEWVFARIVWVCSLETRPFVFLKNGLVSRLCGVGVERVYRWVKHKGNSCNYVCIHNYGTAVDCTLLMLFTSIIVLQT